jgi:hypothetical protein
MEGRENASNTPCATGHTAKKLKRLLEDELYLLSDCGAYKSNQKSALHFHWLTHPRLFYYHLIRPTDIFYSPRFIQADLKKKNDKMKTKEENEIEYELSVQDKILLRKS